MTQGWEEEEAETELWRAARVEAWRKIPEDLLGKVRNSKNTWASTKIN